MATPEPEEEEDQALEDFIDEIFGPALENGLAARIDGGIIFPNHQRPN